MVFCNVLVRVLKSLIMSIMGEVNNYFTQKLNVSSQYIHIVMKHKHVKDPNNPRGLEHFRYL